MIQCPQITTATFRSAADICSNNGSTTTKQQSGTHQSTKAKDSPATCCLLQSTILTVT